jgi:hypothetical protein
MRIISLLTISLALLGAAHVERIPVVIPGLDIGIKQFDQQYGTMVAEVPCTVPYYFVNGTVAQAGQVNANFQALLNCLSTIYASDIIPTSQAQATFGGSLQYNFPAGVAVQGTQNYPLTTVAGPLWLYATGGGGGSYGINFDMNACGGTGSYQFRVAGTMQASLDCQGGYSNSFGSIVRNSITAASGNFIGGTNPAGLCSLLTTNPCLTINQSGNVAAPGNVVASGYMEAVPAFTSLPSPGPVPPCYQSSNSSPCPTTWHTVTGFTTLTSGTTCPASSVCPIQTPGSVATFAPGTPPFTITNGFPCHATNNDIIYNTQTEVQWINATKVQFNIVNPNPTALPNLTQTVAWECTWY